MPNLRRSELIARPGAPFGAGARNPIGARVRKLVEAERRASQEAAATATAKSRTTFHYLREPVSGLKRNGRASTGGRFASHIQWAQDDDGVRLDLEKLNSEAPHWPILEIGTGKTGRMRWGGENGGATQLRTIPSQRGRLIHASLVFAEGGHYAPLGSSRTQQLFYRDQVAGVPRYRRPIRIRREIKGQHFIQKGARTGFRQYQNQVLAAARQSFRKGSP